MFFLDPFSRTSRDDGPDEQWRTRARLICRLVSIGIVVGFYIAHRLWPMAVEPFALPVLAVVLLGYLLSHIL